MPYPMRTPSFNSVTWRASKDPVTPSKLLTPFAGKNVFQLSPERSKTSLTDTVLASACTNLTPEPSQSM
ncbi:hypothetical protein YC2023_025357 [Brassica napus]